MIRPVLALTLFLSAPGPYVAAQTPVTRAQAVSSALERGGRLGVAGADVSVGAAQLLAARARPNPTLSLEFSKSAPQYHFLIEFPLDYTSQRRARIGAAEAERDATLIRYAFSRATVALDADTTYTVAVASIARLALSQRNAAAADSLRRMAVTRRDAGDASDLDVELATVSAGEQANIAASDSLETASALLDLQRVMGMASADITIRPTDSLTLAAISPAASGTGSPLAVAAAEASLNAAEFGIRLQRKSVFSIPSLTFGFETHDPGGGETGILPVIGFSIALPFFDRNRGGIALAEAERARAAAELDLARVESATEIARATRQRANSLARAERDRDQLARADRVTAMTFTAYREGAASLPNALEAQRNARDVQKRYIDDLAAAWIATATLRALTLVSSDGSK